MNPTAIICGLMADNRHAVGFIPEPTVQERYINTGRYILQQDRWGNTVGYLLYTPLHAGGQIVVHQACIDLDNRFKHFGQLAVIELTRRARRRGASAIHLRSTDDIEPVIFWHQCGFVATHLTKGGQRGTRTIVHFRLDLQPIRQ